jgi:hypothetical protein
MSSSSSFKYLKSNYINDEELKQHKYVIEEYFAAINIYDNIFLGVKTT